MEEGHGGLVSLSIIVKAEALLDDLYISPKPIAAPSVLRLTRFVDAKIKPNIGTGCGSWPIELCNHPGQHSTTYRSSPTSSLLPPSLASVGEVDVEVELSSGYDIQLYGGALLFPRTV